MKQKSAGHFAQHFSVSVCKFVFLNVVDDCPQALGHPFIFMIDQLFPDIYIYIHNIEITKLSDDERSIAVTEVRI